MIEKADFIIVGDVTRIHGNTFTYVTVGIEEFVTNPQNMSQIVITIGGEFQPAGGISRDSFYVGEKVFVFVEKVGPYYRVYFGEAGKYRVGEDSYTGLERRTIIDGWYAIPDLWERTVVYSNLTGADSAGGGAASSLAEEPAVVDDRRAVIWSVWLIPVFVVALLVLMKWRKRIL